MAESNKTILTLGALIIAGVALFFIGSYVGNAVFSKRPALTTVQKQEVLGMLNKCIVTSITSEVDTKTTCNDVCNMVEKEGNLSNIKYTCVSAGEGAFIGIEPNKRSIVEEITVRCDWPLYKDEFYSPKMLTCTCCSP